MKGKIIRDCSGIIVLLCLLIISSCKQDVERIIKGTRLSTTEIDTRRIENATTIFSTGYIDQPYVVTLPDKSWLCVYTRSDTTEGALDIRLGVAKSLDKGKTWIIKPDLDGYHSSYVIPYLTPKGRIYAFYTYNTDRVLRLQNGRYISHLLGDMCYKYSDDYGETWSQRFFIKIPKTRIDMTNEFKGKYINWWSICKPIRTENGMYFAFTKKNLDMGEGFILHSPNLDTELNVNNLVWNFYPNASTGIKSPRMGIVQEEHNIVEMNNGNICCIYRTQQGYPAVSYSYDKGKTWSEPQPMRYANGDTIRNPRACPRIYKCDNGNYLFWYHNNSYAWGYRNPGWVSGGVERNGEILWSQPEILLYSTSESNTLLMSYPDFFEDEGSYYITQTQKKTARSSRINKELLEPLWQQISADDEVKNNKIIELTKSSLSSIASKRFTLPSSTSWNGITIELKLKESSLKANNTLLTIFSEYENFPVLQVKTYTDNTYGMELFSNNVYFGRIKSGGEMINKDGSIVLSFSIDQNAQVLNGMINGILFKGNNNTKQGWLRILRANSFNYAFGKIVEVNNSSQIIENVKIYNRTLTTSEQISNYNYSRKNKEYQQSGY